MKAIWMTLKDEIDPERFDSVLGNLEKEQRYARRWREKCLGHFAPIAEGRTE